MVYFNEKLRTIAKLYDLVTICAKVCSVVFRQYFYLLIGGLLKISLESIIYIPLASSWTKVV